MFVDWSDEAGCSTPRRDAARRRADIIRECRPHLLSLALRITRCSADAEDVVQDAFVRWFAQSNVVNDQAWLQTVTSNIAIDYLRKRRAGLLEYEHVQEALDQRDVLWQCPSSPGENIDLAWSCAHLFATLTALERAALIMHDVLDMTYLEIGEKIGRSPSASRQLVCRARFRARICRPWDALSLSTPRVLAFAASLAEMDIPAILGVLLKDIAARNQGASRQAA